MMHKSWQTTVAGILAAIGAGLMATKEPEYLHQIGIALNAAAIAWLGVVSRDNNVSSSSLGLK